MVNNYILKNLAYFMITLWTLAMLGLLYGIWGATFNIPITWCFLGGIYFGGIFVAIVNYLIFEVRGIEV